MLDRRVVAAIGQAVTKATADLEARLGALERKAAALAEDVGVARAVPEAARQAAIEAGRSRRDEGGDTL